MGKSINTNGHGTAALSQESNGAIKELNRKTTLPSDATLTAEEVRELFTKLDRRHGFVLRMAQRLEQLEARTADLKEDLDNRPYLIIGIAEAPYQIEFDSVNFEERVDVLEKGSYAIRKPIKTETAEIVKSVLRESAPAVSFGISVFAAFLSLFLVARQMYYLLFVPVFAALAFAILGAVQRFVYRQANRG